ncbi:MAG: hypothetical protein NWE91_05530 [Candidatus Bathyarchaeota archaeon]|nr:hypothetical protein [Candidatus Bathyarchaeota archaeon]
MSDGIFSLKKAVPIIVVTWILSLVTTLAITYFVPFVPIGTSQIGDGVVTGDKMANGTIITMKLADGTVTSAKILDGTITAVDLADGSIVSVKITDGAVTTAKIADGSVTTVKIADGALVTVKLANDTVTSEKIADGNVTTADLADGAVTTSNIVDNAIVEVKLADGSVTSAKIVDGTITAVDMATGAVTSTRIANGAVTTSKIANYAVTSLKLAADAIPYNSTVQTSEVITSSSIMEDMPYTSVNITLSRNSTLLIMFSSEASNPTAGSMIHLTASVNGTDASPHNIYFTPTDVNRMCSYAYNFIYFNATAGFYTIQMRWRVTGGSTGVVWYRTLVVIALPA